MATGTKKHIIAVVGLPGSGKSEAVHYLVMRYKFPKVYFGKVTFDEMERRGLEINEQNERMVREDLRSVHGDDYYARETLKEVTGIDAPIVIVESLYSWAEYQVFRQAFAESFVTIAVHAAPRVRYERLAHRAKRPLNPEEAYARDVSQMDRLTQAMPIAMADHMVVNEADVESFQEKIDTVIRSILEA